MDWSSFFIGIGTSYLVSLVLLFALIREKPKTKCKEHNPTYKEFDRNSGRASMGWGDGDYH